VVREEINHGGELLFVDQFSAYKLFIKLSGFWSYGLPKLNLFYIVPTALHLLLKTGLPIFRPYGASNSSKPEDQETGSP